MSGYRLTVTSSANFCAAAGSEACAVVGPCRHDDPARALDLLAPVRSSDGRPVFRSENAMRPVPVGPHPNARGHDPVVTPLADDFALELHQ